MIKPDRLPANAQLLVHYVLNVPAVIYLPWIVRHFEALHLDWIDGNFEPRPLKSIEDFPALVEDVVFYQSCEEVNRLFVQIMSKWKPF